MSLPSIATECATSTHSVVWVGMSTINKPENAAVGAVPQVINLVVVWRTLRKHWSTAIATLLAVSLAVTFYTLGQTKIYQASVTIQFDPQAPRPLGKDVDMVVDVGAGNYWNN